MMEENADFSIKTMHDTVYSVAFCSETSVHVVITCIIRDNVTSEYTYQASPSEIKL